MTRRKEIIDMENKDIKTCIINGYGYDGEGVGRIDGKVVFVPYTLIDEDVEIEITEEKSSFYRAKLNKVNKCSEKREEPPCPYYGRCGGCSYQHTGYENEIEIKRQLLISQLEKVDYHGEVKIEVSLQRYAYRNKIKLVVGEGKLGLRERGSHNICQIKKCMLVSEEINKAIEIIQRFLDAQKLYNYYDEILIRQEGNNLGVVFSCKKEYGKVNYQGVFLMLGSNFSIYEKYKDTLIHQMGRTCLQSEEHGLVCNFLPTSFHQVNIFISKRLYEFVKSKVVGQTVANCYSGAGVLSGIIAQEGKRVIGIELGQSEHEDAERLKSENNLFYLTNMHGDCAEVLPKLEEVDCVIVDPPRAGMDKKVCEAINVRRANRIIYISCNSATLVRDIARLTEYELKEVTMFDMFACTGEYEVVAILDKKVK